MVEESNSQRRKLTQEERFDPDRFLPEGARIYRRRALDSQGWSTTGRSESYEYGGRSFECGSDRQWSVSHKGLDRLAELGRLEVLSNQTSLMWKSYEDEYPGRKINNIWSAQMAVQNKRYVVQTAEKTIQRCILMSSDPGDIVLDPTCGSGTTAFVAEQWGRRWISCDTSRVAIAIARQRMITSVFDYYKLAHPQEGVGSGFSYQRSSTVSAKSLGYDEPKKEIPLYDQPQLDRSKARVTGPFTIEAVPAPVVKPIDEIKVLEQAPADNSVARMGQTLRQSDWREELMKTGIRGRLGQKITFARLETLPGLHWLHAEGEVQFCDGETKDPEQNETTSAKVERVVVSFGPDYAPMEQKQVELAIQEARHLVPQPRIVIFAAFQLDPEASKDIYETNWPKITLLEAQMNTDLLTGDLQKNRSSNESFWLIGQPDLRLEPMGDVQDAKFRIIVEGFDFFNTKTGNVESGGKEKIALWMLDPDYDGRSLFARQVFFPMTEKDRGWAKLARNLRAEIDPNLVEAYKGTVSLPFVAGEHNRAAVKIVDDRGIESLKIVDLR